MNPVPLRGIDAKGLGLRPLRAREWKNVSTSSLASYRFRFSEDFWVGVRKG
jgi:hypothetical protein